MDNEIAYGINGNTVSLSYSSLIMVELKTEVDMLWRRYGVDDRSGSAHVLERQERIATAW
jgi:hypothetical protein